MPLFQWGIWGSGNSNYNDIHGGQSVARAGQGWESEAELNEGLKRWKITLLTRLATLKRSKTKRSFK